MVMLVDLAKETVLTSPHAHCHSFHQLKVTSFPRVGDVANAISAGKDRLNPNVTTFSAALGCYPVVSQLAQHLDLNDLDSLSLTCRQFRVNLLQFRQQLVTKTLRCSRESVTTDPHSDDVAPIPKLTSGKVAPCARDMVSDCRRCGTVVCRNCTSKPPASRELLQRHRRLCPTCVSLPISAHTTGDPDAVPCFTGNAFAQTPCTCASTIHICVPCGQGLRTADTTYSRVWTWRTRYSNLGGLGTGIGEGNEGVKCGRGQSCFAAEDKEVEVDMDSSSSSTPSSSPGRSPTPSSCSPPSSIIASADEGEIKGPIYGTREIQGIGGVVKRKLITSVRVGACVKEWDEERETGTFLRREREGNERSWCSWCWRVIPGGVRDEGYVE